LKVVAVVEIAYQDVAPVELAYRARNAEHSIRIDIAVAGNCG
jgi:hypothetical protein